MSRSNHAETGYVFISYASADRERVLPVVAALRDAGVRIWIDRDDIAGGSVYAPEIVDSIEGCTTFVLMCSAASLASPNVHQEIALAWKYRRPYLPLLLEPVTIPREVEYWLEGAQWIEILAHPRDTWLKNVVAALDHLGPVGGPPAMPASPPARPTAPQQRISIPTPLTALVGRQTAIEEIAGLLQSARLVTLTGPGGTGKTRLSIAVCHAVSQAFPDGVVFIPLAAVRDPAVVIPAVAAALDVREAGAEPILTILSRVIGDRRLLLVLDNLEQIIDAAADISALLVACPRLHVVATSRSPLHVSGEREYLVMPLSIPAAGSGDDIQHIVSSAAVALFVDHAQAVRRDFALTRENAAAVVDICRRLDGLPLALELAAARTKLMTPQAILTRLEHPLAVLTGGARDLPERQQTIRATIQWSYDLLSDAEQRLFRRLSVFVDGWSLDAAEAVGATGDADVLDILLSLVEKSLVTQVEQPNGEERFSTLITIHEFGREKLRATGELMEFETQHATYFTQLVEEMALLRRSSQQEQFDALEREHDNLRSALSWGIENDSGVALRLAVALWPFWDNRGYHREGRDWLTRALVATPYLPSHTHAMALVGVGGLARRMGLLDEARSAADDAIMLLQESDESRTLSNALHIRGAIHFDDGEFEQARIAFEDSLRLADQDDRPPATLNGLGAVYHVLRDYARAQQLYDESLLRFTQVQDVARTATVIGNLGELAHDQGDLDTARLRYQRSMDISEKHRNTASTAYFARMLGRLEFDCGNHHDAWTNLAKSMRLSFQMGNMRRVRDNLLALADVALAQERVHITVQLLGAVNAVRSTGLLAPSPDVEDNAQILQTLREQLGVEAFEVNWTKGFTHSPLEIVNGVSATT